MPIEIQNWITREDLRANPDKLYVFGDNLEHRGYGGQARSMRGEPNAYGVPTKAKPARGNDVYLDDKNPQHWRAVQTSLRELERELLRGKTVVLPRDGIGTGLAKMQEKCPELFAYITTKLELMKKRFRDGEINERSG